MKHIMVIYPCTLNRKGFNANCLRHINLVDCFVDM